MYRKKVNGTYYIVEAVPDSKYKKLWVVSAYMSEKGGVTQAPNAQGPGNTPNASLASPPNLNIAQPGQTVNTQNIVPETLQNRAQTMDERDGFCPRHDLRRL